MEQYLPFIKTLLSEWYLLTLNNPLYAAALAATVWLLTATLYSIRIASLKRGNRANEKKVHENLNAAQQQLQHTQAELVATNEQLEKAQSTVQVKTQRALALEQLIYQRNQQIAGIIQTLATSFDLGERPILATEDAKAESLWEQHGKVVLQLIERLRNALQAKTELQQTCQAETVKLAEKEALLDVLQTTLSNQLSRLEQAVEEQKIMLQQQSDAQQALSASLKTYQQPTAPQPVKPEPELFKAWQQQESPAIEETLITQTVDNSIVEPIIEEPQAAATRWPDEVEQEIIEQPQAETRWQDEDEQTPITMEEPTIEAAPSTSPFSASQQMYEKIPPESSNSEQQPASPAKGSFGKIKNLFGKSKQQPVNPPKGSLGKIKNLFGKSKK